MCVDFPPTCNHSYIVLCSVKLFLLLQMLLLLKGWMASEAFSSRFVVVIIFVADVELLTFPLLPAVLFTWYYKKKKKRRWNDGKVLLKNIIKKREHWIRNIHEQRWQYDINFYEILHVVPSSASTVIPVAGIQSNKRLQGEQPVSQLANDAGIHAIRL